MRGNTVINSDLIMCRFEKFYCKINDQVYELIIVKLLWNNFIHHFSISYSWFVLNYLLIQINNANFQPLHQFIDSTNKLKLKLSWLHKLHKLILNYLLFISRLLNKSKPIINSKSFIYFLLVHSWFIESNLKLIFSWIIFKNFP